jgi:hypothetical protein
MDAEHIAAADATEEAIRSKYFSNNLKIAILTVHSVHQD